MQERGFDPERERALRIMQEMSEKLDNQAAAESKEAVEFVAPEKTENAAVAELVKRIKSPENYKGPTELATTDGNFSIEWTRDGWVVTEQGLKPKLYKNKVDVMVSHNNMLVIAGKQRGMITPPLEKAA